MGVEQFWHDEMEESPKLSHGVLYRCASQKKPVSCVELQQNFPSPTQVIFDGLSLVKDHVVPFNF